jgi:hypothetical protein
LRTRILLFAFVAALVVGVQPAGATTKTVGFDDQLIDTRVSNQYEASRGVNFSSDAYTRPVVKQVGGLAHSGDRVGIFRCDCGEFYPTPVIRGQLSSSVNSVSAYVGYYHDPSHVIDQDNPAFTASVRILAYDVDNQLVQASPYVTVTEGQAFNQQVSASSPSGRTIDHFEVSADPSAISSGPIAIDDVAVTIDDAAPPPPPNFTLNSGLGVTEVLTGTSVDVPLSLNRVNGSNGGISFAVTGLPPGLTASFNPNPVPGTGSSTVMTLTAAAKAPHSDEYSDITITATPTSPGAGSAPRSFTAPMRIRENCDRTVRTEYLDARSDGCMVKKGNAHEATDTEVRVNGLVIKPADDSHPTLVIDDQAKTIKGKSLTMPFTVAADTNPDIPIYAGPIDWEFSSGSGSREVIGLKLSGIPVLKGLPITELSASFTKGGATVLKPTLKLDFWPFNYFGAVTSTAAFQVDNDHPPDFTGLGLKLDKVNALALELKDVVFKWHEGGNWSGSAKLVLHFAKTYTVAAGFGIKNGDFDYLNGSVSGLNQPIGTGIFLQSIGFDVHRNPLMLSGTIGFSGGPQVHGVRAIGVDGTLTAVLADPWVVQVSGNAKVANRFELGDAFVRYSSTGLFEFGANANFDLWRLSLNGGVSGWVDGLDAFNVEGTVSACLDVWGPNVCGDARALLSSKGVAGCIGAYGYYVGAGATWDLDFDAFTGCDLSPYREIQGSRVRAAGELVRTTLPKGLPSAAWEVTGEGGPANVTLIGPGGEAVTVTRAAPVVQNERFYAQLRQDGTTFVLVNKPAAGVWTLSDDGAVPIKRVREARGLPKASVSAKVSGSGRSRVLSWKLRPIKGQRVTFAEEGKDVRNAITSTTSKRGSVRFRPADGPAGKRAIVAMVEQDGQPRVNLTVGSYRAPGPPKPGKPRGLKLTRKGTRLTVSWRPNPSGFRHAVYLVLGDGRKLVNVVDAKRRSFTLKGVSSKVGAKVRVLGLTPANGKGPAAATKIKGKH